MKMEFSPEIIEKQNENEIKIQFGCKFVIVQLSGFLFLIRSILKTLLMTGTHAEFPGIS